MFLKQKSVCEAEREGKEGESVKKQVIKSNYKKGKQRCYLNQS